MKRAESVARKIDEYRKLFSKELDAPKPTLNKQDYISPCYRGKPIKILYRHLDDIHAIAYQETDMRLFFTGGADGMILCLGKQTT